MTTTESIVNSPQDSRLEVVESCRICGSRAFEPALLAGAWQLWRCDSCGIVFTSPRYTTESLAALYGSSYYEHASEYFSSQIASPSPDHFAIARQAARHVHATNPASIDIGTGCGRQVAAFAAMGFQSRGTEPSDIACDIARRHGRDVINADIAELPSESFDCVTAFHVLEHVPEPLNFVRHMARVTVPEGIVVIEVPNFASPAARRLGASWHALYPDTHLFHFTPATLAGVCRRAGLVITATHRIGGIGLFHARSPSASFEGAVPGHASRSRELRASQLDRIRASIWNLRRPLFRIPGLRPFCRWVIWELLGYGEFVRVIARKPSSP